MSVIHDAYCRVLALRDHLPEKITPFGFPHDLPRWRSITGESDLAFSVVAAICFLAAHRLLASEQNGSDRCILRRNGSRRGLC